MIDQNKLAGILGSEIAGKATECMGVVGVNLNANRLSRDVSQELKAALNLIGEYCREHLPDGWEISVLVNNEEMSVTLTDPDGDDHDGFESGEDCVIVDACDHARNTQDDCQLWTPVPRWG